MPARDPAPRTKVWRPRDFDGLELERFDDQRDLVVPAFVLMGHELTVVFEGDATIEYAGARYRYTRTRDLFLAQHPGEAFSGDARSDRKMSVWTIRLFPELIASATRDLGMGSSSLHFRSMTVPDALNAPLAAKVARTIRAFDEGASRLERESRLLDLLASAWRALADTDLRARRVGGEHRAVGLVRRLLDDHPAMDVTLADLAELTELNKHYLFRVFRREVGVSPHVYQTVRRVHRAKELLVAGRPIARVAAETGFADQSHLTRVFRKYTQVTPGRFQRDSLAA